MMTLTKEQFVEEIIKCRQSPLYYIETYGKVRHPMKGVVPFALFPFQKDVIIKVLNNRFVIIVKGRQLGLSTVMSAYCTWLATFFNSKQILVLANKGDVATNFVNKCKVFVRYTPDYLRPKILVNNRQSIEFDNGSVIKASTTTTDAARSEALSLLVIDEASIIEKVEEVWTAARPTLSTGGACVVISTPHGVGNWFHKKYEEAESGLSDNGLVNFVPMKLKWNLHPERTQAWADKELADLGTMKFAQENEASFEKSGNTVIDYDTLKWIEDTTICNPIDKAGFDHNFWIWKTPQIGKNYIVCGDVARGDGEDYCASHVICVEDSEQVAEYKGKITPDVFGNLLVEMGTKYNNAMIVCENNAMGYASVQRILDHQYRNLYWTKKSDGVIFVDPLNWNMPGPDKIPGFQTTTKTRTLVISALEEALRTKSLIIHSSRFLGELKVFVWTPNGKAEAVQGYNDDLVMAAGIGTYVRNTTLRQSTQGLAQVAALIGSIGMSQGAELLISSSRDANKQNDPYVIPGTDDNLRWLLDK